LCLCISPSDGCRHHDILMLLLLKRCSCHQLVLLLLTPGALGLQPLGHTEPRNGALCIMSSFPRLPLLPVSAGCFASSLHAAWVMVGTWVTVGTWSRGEGCKRWRLVYLLSTCLARLQGLLARVRMCMCVCVLCCLCVTISWWLTVFVYVSFSVVHVYYCCMPKPSQRGFRAGFVIARRVWIRRWCGW
jgi:hypothetical protein